MIEFKSQVGQDAWVCAMLENKVNGFFVEIGSSDGIALSNTYYLEKELLWDGICVEANKDIFPKLVENRRAKCVNKAIYSYNGEVSFATGQEIYGIRRRLQVPVEVINDRVGCYTLHTLFEKYPVPPIIDYISIDVEGADYDVLIGFPFPKYDVKLWTIEHNTYLDGGALKAKIREIMLRWGYNIYEGEMKSEWADIFEDWFINPKYFQ